MQHQHHGAKYLLSVVLTTTPPQYEGQMTGKYPECDWYQSDWPAQRVLSRQIMYPLGWSETPQKEEMSPPNYDGVFFSAERAGWLLRGSIANILGPG